ncbi:MAG: class I SAM-dependent methyltransferase [Burkholderiaceae bacterium]|jgi:SAM-dependent methyltransferase
MIGKLLKELAIALVRYVRYHIARILHLRVANPGPPQVAPTTAATNSGLPFDIGLDPAYQAPFDWPTYRDPVELPELLADPFYQLWTTIPDGHKWSHYFGIYERVLGTKRALPMRILEIGVYKGSSLNLWRSYFSHRDTVIVGVDIEPGCMQFNAPERGISVRIGSQTDGAFLGEVNREFGPFDLIIDDGSHHSAHIIASFNILFAEALKESGIYFVEDLHANYWPNWRDSEKSFLDLCKELIELMHAHYVEVIPDQVFVRSNPNQWPFVKVAAITPMLEEIRIFDSIVAITKTRRQYVPYYVTMEEAAAANQATAPQPAKA